MTLSTLVKSIIAVGAGVLALGSTSCTPQAHLGFNSLETAYILDQDSEDRGVKNKAIVNASASLGDAQASVHVVGFMTDGDEDNAFSFQRVYAGHKDFPVKLEYAVKTLGDELIDQKVGIRDFWLMNQLPGKGYIEALVDIDEQKENRGAQLVLFYLQPLGKGYSVQALQSLDLPFDGEDIGSLTEIQVDKKLTDHVTAFARVEANDFVFDEGEARYMIGIAVSNK